MEYKPQFASTKINTIKEENKENHYDYFYRENRREIVGLNRKRAPLREITLDLDPLNRVSARRLN